MNSDERLRSLLAKLNISRVAIIDDAYDPPHTTKELVEDLNALIDEEVPGLAELLDLSEADLRTLRLFDNSQVEKLWRFASGQRDDELAARLREVFQNHVDRLAPLETLEDALCKVVTVNRLAPSQASELRSADLWLFDLYWSTDPDGQAWGESARVARAQYESTDNEEAPVFVLMSEDDNALRRHKEEFRVAAAVPVGYFLTMDKSILSGDDPQQAMFEWLAETLDAKKITFHRRVYGLTRAIHRAGTAALERYRGHLDELAAEDFAHVYINGGLEYEGAPLGSYMLWLLEPLFEHYLKENDAVRRCCDQLDALTADEIPQLELLERKPSGVLSEIFYARMWERSPKGIQEGLKQGDLLTRNGDPGKVFLVMNGDCDLVSSDRRKKPGLSVLLLPGKVDADIGAVSTDFFQEQQQEGQRAVYLPRRIEWDINGVQVEPYRGITARHQKRGWRLRRPYLTEIVQRWGQNATRVGTPVRPPMVESVECVSVSVRQQSRWSVSKLEGHHYGGVYRRVSSKGKKKLVVVFANAEKLGYAMIDACQLPVDDAGRPRDAKHRADFNTFLERHANGGLELKPMGEVPNDGAPRMGCTVTNGLHVLLYQYDTEEVGADVRVILRIRRGASNQ